MLFIKNYNFTLYLLLITVLNIGYYSPLPPEVKHKRPIFTAAIAIPGKKKSYSITIVLSQILNTKLAKNNGRKASNKIFSDLKKLISSFIVCNYWQQLSWIERLNALPVNFNNPNFQHFLFHNYWQHSWSTSLLLSLENLL